MTTGPASASVLPNQIIFWNQTKIKQHAMHGAMSRGRVDHIVSSRIEEMLIFGKSKSEANAIWL